MRLRSFVQILTLVLCFYPEMASTSPSLPAPPSALSNKNLEESGEGPARPYELESLSMAPSNGPLPENFQSLLSSTRQVRTHSRVVTTDLWTGSLLSKTSETALGASLIVQNENRNESSQSYGLSVLSNTAYGVHWDFQYHCCLGDYYEPTWGFGIGSLWSTGDSLAAIANIEHYHLRGRLAFEDLFNLNRRLNGALVFKVSPLGFSFQAGLGWTWDESEFLF